MTSFSQVRDEVMEMFRDAWLADSDSASVSLVFENSANSEKPSGQDADGRAQPWAWVAVRSVSEEQDTLGAQGARRYLARGSVLVMIRTPYGDGYALADTLSRIAKLAFRGRQTPSGAWFSDVSSRELGLEGPWSRVDVTATFEFEDVG